MWITCEMLFDHANLIRIGINNVDNMLIYINRRLISRNYFKKATSHLIRYKLRLDANCIAILK
jgi:hypothetical protein